VLDWGALDPRWTIVLDSDPRLERVHETLCTLADGHVGTRGAREEGEVGAVPLTVAAGVYDDSSGGGSGPALLAGPQWTGLELTPPGVERDRRVLDLRGGVLWRELAGAWGVLRTMRFASLARPGVVGLRAEGPWGVLRAGPPLCPPAAAVAFEQGDADGVVWAQSQAPRGGGITAAAWQRDDGGDPDGGDPRVVERLAAYLADPERAPAAAAATARLRAIREVGFDALLAEHRHAWAQRWADANVAIDGDPEVELALRFALFHLLSAVAGTGEAAVGARGLSGPAYAGHVFWDADVFVLPVLAAVHPPAARAMLEYRVRRLPAARRLAVATGLEGARFPWESAADGTDVTPTSALDPQGQIVAIRTGELEEHVVADVAWAACRYAAWTGDEAFLDGPGRDLVLDTARYWAARARVDEDGHAHIDGVIGPDEYHEDVHDNAFTNVMARWNLRRAADLAQRGGSAAAEADAWRRLAAALVDGYDPQTGIYEQFAGFHRLEPLLVSAFAQPPAAADMLLGYGRVRQTQVVKQADVLMLHLLVPEEVAPGSLGPNLAHYGPRTAHGSSLSPAVHAALLARAGQPDEGLALLRLACRLDLDDLVGSTARGLHVANLGGNWQALAHGFLGLHPGSRALALDPRLPPAWRSVELCLRYHGRRVRLRAGSGHIDLAVDGPVAIALPNQPARTVTPPGTRYIRTGTTWREQP
jgi:trehalose/maltose hydrolase-like predicted phosphorylase